jgi:hypothetical protein
MTIIKVHLIVISILSTIKMNLLSITLEILSVKQVEFNIIFLKMVISLKVVTAKILLLILMITTIK